MLIRFLPKKHVGGANHLQHPRNEPNSEVDSATGVVLVTAQFDSNLLQFPGNPPVILQNQWFLWAPKTQLYLGYNSTHR